MNIEWVVLDEPLPEQPVFGDRHTAEIAVNITIEDDGTKQYYTQCLCASCDLIDQIGIEDALGTDEMEEGVHYMKHHVEVYHGIPAVSETEYDVWLIPAEPKGDDDE